MDSDQCRPRSLSCKWLLRKFLSVTKNEERDNCDLKIRFTISVFAWGYLALIKAFWLEKHTQAKVEICKNVYGQRTNPISVMQLHSQECIVGLPYLWVGTRRFYLPQMPPHTSEGLQHVMRSDIQFVGGVLRYRKARGLLRGPQRVSKTHPEVTSHHILEAFWGDRKAQEWATGLAQPPEDPSWLPDKSLWCQTMSTRTPTFAAFVIHRQPGPTAVAVMHVAWVTSSSFITAYITAYNK